MLHSLSVVSLLTAYSSTCYSLKAAALRSTGAVSVMCVQSYKVSDPVNLCRLSLSHMAAHWRHWFQMLCICVCVCKSDGLFCLEFRFTPPWSRSEDNMCVQTLLRSAVTYWTYSRPAGHGRNGLEDINMLQQLLSS